MAVPSTVLQTVGGRAVVSTTVGVSEEFAVQNVSREALETQCGLVMETLLALEGTGCLITSPAVSVDLSTSTVTIEVDATGENFDAAVALAESCIHSAIREASGTDPDWEYRQQQRHAQLVDA